MSAVLVTGGAGFIGSALARALLKSGRRVIIADNISSGRRGNVPPECDFIEIDLGDRSQYGKLAAARFDAVLHAAGQSSGEASFADPWYDFNSHVTSTFLLLQLCRERKVPRFLYASSMAVYGDPAVMPVAEEHAARPKSFYAAAKLAAESYVGLYQSLGIATTVFRMFSVYGPNQDLANKMQGMVSIYLSYLLEGNPIIVKGDPARFRDFIFIEDVVNAWLAALDHPQSIGRTYNLASGTRTTVRELLDALLAAWGRRDHPIRFADGTPGDQFGMVADISRVQSDLGWTPRWDLRSGIAAMLAFHRSAQPGAA